MGGWRAVRAVALAAAWLVLGACGNQGKSELRSVQGALLLDPPSLDFGDVALGRATAQTATLRNAGVLALHVDSPDAAAARKEGFIVTGLPADLQPGESVQLGVQFAPQQLGGAAHALSLTGAAASASQLGLSGNAVLGLVRLDGDVLDFGPVALGEQSQLSFTLTSDDGNAETAAQLGTAEGGDGTFSSALTGTLSLRPVQQRTVAVTFAPVRAGDFTGTLQLVPCPTCQPHPIQLRGSGANSLLIVRPASLDFGVVMPGQPAALPFTLQNISHQPLALTGTALSGQPGFTVQLGSTAQAQQLLAPGATLTAQARFAPDQLGALSATAQVSAAHGAPGLLALAGTSMGPRLEARPASVNLSAASVGTLRSRTIILANAGFDPQGKLPLVISSISVQGGAFSLHTPTLPWTVGAPGDQGPVTIDFRPPAGATYNDVIMIASNDPIHPLTTVPLTALGRVLAPCKPRIEPAGTVDFGAVPVGHPSTQGFEIVNDGAEDCILGEPRITSGGDVFSWPGGSAPAGRQIAPGGRLSVRIEFAPGAESVYTGGVAMYLSNAAQPELEVALRGAGDAGCFVLAPGTVSFGAAASGCTATDQTAYAHNWCARPVTLSSVSTDRAQFAVGAGLTLPAVIAPNGTLPITVTYKAGAPGDDVGALAVVTDTRATPYQVGLTGGASVDTAVHDAWDQSTPKVDLLFVIDNSGSMADKQMPLQQNLGRLWDRIAIADADYHIAVTTSGMKPYTQGWTQCTGGASGGEAGRFFPVDNSRPRILTPQTPDVKTALFQNIDVGLCHWDERFLEPIVAALTPPLSTSAKAPDTPWPADGNAGFLRDDARLGILVLTDTDDDAKNARPPPIGPYIDQIIQVKHGAVDMISFAALVPLTQCTAAEMYPVPRMQAIAQALHGSLADVCDLANLGSSLESLLGSLLQPLTGFPLSARPYDPGLIEVRVDGVLATQWSYDAAANRIVFAQAAVPVPGSHITADYASACH